MDMQVPFRVRTARRPDPVIEVRNRDICNRYAAGETLAAIGRSFCLSIEGVRKILKKSGLDKSNAGLAVRNRGKPRKPPVEVEPHCLRTYGCAAEELKKYTRAQRRAFLQQRTNVRRTDVPWSLTLPEWCDVWLRSHKWAQRGRGPFKYGLYRIDSDGGFSAGNVLVMRNSRSARRNLKVANQLPVPGFHREAWILANLGGGKHRTDPFVTISAMRKSVFRRAPENVARTGRTWLESEERGKK